MEDVTAHVPFAHHYLLGPCPQIVKPLKVYLKSNVSSLASLFSWKLTALITTYLNAQDFVIDLPCLSRLVLCLCRGCHRIQCIYRATQVNFRNRKLSGGAQRCQTCLRVPPGAVKRTSATSLHAFFECELASNTFTSAELRSALRLLDFVLSDCGAFRVFPETLPMVM